MMKTLIVVLLIFLTACSLPTTPETKIYSLNMQTENKLKDKVIDASLAIIVDSPRYLSQPYIVYRDSPYQLNISRYSRWDNPPSVIVSENLKDSLSNVFNAVMVSNTVPEGFYALNIKLRKFERIDEGNNSSGTLIFDFKLIAPDGRYLHQGAILKVVKLDDRSFLSLAKGMSIALKEGTEEMRMSIIKSIDMK